MIQIAVLITIVVFLVGLLLYYIFKMILVPKQVGEVEKLLKAKQYSQALKHIKQMLGKKGNNQMAAKLHHYMGDAYLGTDNKSMAIVEYKVALRDGKTEPLKFEVKTREKLASTFQGLNKLEDALNEYLLLTKIDPNNDNHYFEIGKLYYNSNQIDKAISFLSKALEINHVNGEAYYLLGIAKYHTGRESEALDFLTKALKYDPKNASIHYHLGKIYRNMHDYVKALEEFEVSVKDNEYRAQSLLERGLCFIEMGDSGKARIELERGLQYSSPDNVKLATRYTLANCYENERDLMPAIEQWESIVKVKPDYKDVQDKLHTYADLRHDDALKDFLTVGQSKYEELSRKVVQVMGLKVLDLHSESNGDLVINAQEVDDNKMRSASMLGRIIRIRRETDKIHEPAIRELLEKTKNQKAARAVFISAAKFTDQAIQYAQSRPIDLIDGNGLQSLLKKAQNVSLDDDTGANGVNSGLE